MRISELSRTCGCSVETIRYYESVGLLSAPRRAANGYRVYSDEHRKWLQLVRRSRDLGLPQDEVRLLIKIARDESAACEDVYRLLSSHVQRVSTRIRELKQLEKSLIRLQSRCADGRSKKCPAIDELMK
ncbi:MAG: MerR family transcriptional regulator [Betaproteobacteria bacterium]|nr:MAG: MerR family transcriptional regulator [Betaproteobacteria bacterium]